MQSDIVTDGVVSGDGPRRAPGAGLDCERGSSGTVTVGQTPNQLNKPRWYRPNGTESLPQHRVNEVISPFRWTLCARSGLDACSGVRRQDARIHLGQPRALRAFLDAQANGAVRSSVMAIGQGFPADLDANQEGRVATC